MTDDDTIPINAADDETLVIFGDASVVNVATGGVWRNSGVCRWVQRKLLSVQASPADLAALATMRPGALIAAMPDDDLRAQTISLSPILQQAWQNAATGAVEWRDVPTEAE